MQKPSTAAWGHENRSRFGQAAIRKRLLSGETDEGLRPIPYLTTCEHGRPVDLGKLSLSLRGVVWLEWVGSASSAAT